MDKSQAYNETLSTLRRDLTEAEGRVKQLREAIAAVERLVTPQVDFFAIGNRVVVHSFKPSKNGLRGLSMIDAAQKVLVDAGRPMHIMDIVEEMLSRGFQYDKDRAALRASLTGSLERKDVFRRVNKATYGLSVWSEPEKVPEKKAGAAE